MKKLARDATKEERKALNIHGVCSVKRIRLTALPANFSHGPPPITKPPYPECVSEKWAEHTGHGHLLQPRANEQPLPIFAFEIPDGFLTPAEIDPYPVMDFETTTQDADLEANIEAKGKGSNSDVEGEGTNTDMQGKGENTIVEGEGEK